MRQILAAAAGPSASVGCDQFVYFDASDPQRKCAPDGFVKLDVPDELFDTWKTWEKGTPELCVEILSPSDTREKLPLEEKLSRFHTMGASEVIAFDADAPVGRRLRAWDLVEGDLVERVIENESTPCRTLELWFVVTRWSPRGTRQSPRRTRSSQRRTRWSRRTPGFARSSRAEANEAASTNRQLIDLLSSVRTGQPYVRARRASLPSGFTTAGCPTTLSIGTSE